MNSNISSANGKQNRILTVADARPHPGIDTSVTGGEKQAAQSAAGQWRILLCEFIHLLGLFWIHSTRSKGTRATDVLFSQLVKHLRILEKMPGHDGGVLVRRVHCRGNAFLAAPEFLVLFGPVMINSKEDLVQPGNEPKKFAHLKRALSRAFECFAEQEIHSLYVRIPGHSPAQIEHFRFSVNVLPRYYAASKDGSSIAFRYYGRTLTLPMIRDGEGRFNPNLTLMAALNGLAEANARELVHQARAYHKIRLAENSDAPDLRDSGSTYDQIFKIRSLKTQLIRPPVEINNLFCPYHPCIDKPGQSCLPGLAGKAINCMNDPVTHDIRQRTDNTNAIPVRPARKSSAGALKELSRYVDSSDPFVVATLNALFSDDFGALDAVTLAKRFVAATRLFHAIDRKCGDPGIIDRILELLQKRLKDVPDEVMANIITQRQGLKLVSGGRSIMVGLVHPKLFDLITLMKEHVVAHQRIDLIKEIAFNVDPCHINSLADCFGISTTDANQIIGLLHGCFGFNGSFIRPTFESRVDDMTRHENVIFEILWCFLKQTPHRSDRLNFLNAIQLLMARLNDPKRALQFLLADICQDSQTIDFTDRNAFALANVFLHKENQELYIDVNRTPEDVLKIQRPMDSVVHRYANWRLGVDHARYLEKARTIAGRIGNVVTTSAGEDPGRFELRFLLALERELLIFSALVAGYTGRTVVREALALYGDPHNDIYRHELTHRYLSQLMPHLQIAVRALGRAGNHEDIKLLNTLVNNSDAFSGLDSHPAHGLRVKQMMKWVPEAVRMIRTRN